MWNNSHREYASPDAISYDPQRWLWQYRKGAFDTREQKRLLISPHGDGTDDNGDDYAHLWEYSLTGVAGELYVLYKGLQTATTTEPNENKTDGGRRVYISPFKYYSAGGELQFQADGTTKEVHITDNLGSVRSIVIWDDVGLKDIKSFDYKPFGELDGGDEPTKHGFATAEYDGESSCFAMGMRMYSAELGRFLSVDPLFEAMPRHTPYHYSFNSPLVWKDPSGLIPENEKDQDRLMMLYTYDVERAEAAYQGALVESNYRFMEAWANAVDSFFDLMIDWKNSPEARGGGGGGRTGEDGSGENGVTKVDYKYDGLDSKGDATGTIILEDKEGNTAKVPVLIDGRAAGDDPENMFKELVAAFEIIIAADPQYLLPLFDGKYEIEILPGGDIASDYFKGKNAKVSILGGKHSFLGRQSAKISIASELLNPKNKHKIPFQLESTNLWGRHKTERYLLWEAIAHEFGHEFDLLQYGTYMYFYIFDYETREGLVIEKVNRLRVLSGNGKRLEKLP